jgi:hypothetical protein
VVKGDGLLQSAIERVRSKGTVTILGAFTREWWLSLFANGANHPVIELHHGLRGLYCPNRGLTTLLKIDPNV